MNAALIQGDNVSKGYPKVATVEADQSADYQLNDHALAIVSFINNRVIAGAAAALRKQVGLSVTEARIVFHLGFAEMTTANKLVKGLGLDKAAISRAISRLIKLDLIHSEQDPDHAGRNLLTLTAAGQAQQRKIAHFTFARENYLLNVLSDEEQRQFLQSLQKILPNVEVVNDLVAKGRFWDK